jgi:hypothetical protein
MTNNLYDIVNQYVNFEIAGKKFNIPYCMAFDASEKPLTYHRGRTQRFKNYGGKGSPEQIRKALIKTAQKHNLNLTEASTEEIKKLMVQHGIGIDCSGFVYHVLDRYLRERYHTSLARHILRYPGAIGVLERIVLRPQRVRRCSAATLTSKLNTIEIELVKDMQPGDMIRLTHADWKGKHIAIIVDVDAHYITYAAASEYTKDPDCHLAKIEIIDSTKGLEAQNWLEQTQDNKKYVHDAYDPTRGDSVRRLKYLASQLKL